MRIDAAKRHPMNPMCIYISMVGLGAQLPYPNVPVMDSPPFRCCFQLVCCSPVLLSPSSSTSTSRVPSHHDHCTAQHIRCSQVAPRHPVRLLGFSPRPFTWASLPRPPVNLRDLACDVAVELFLIGPTLPHPLHVWGAPMYQPFSDLSCGSYLSFFTPSPSNISGLVSIYLCVI